MNKSILVFTIASILILGTLSLGPAYAVEIGDTISIKGQTNKVEIDPAFELPTKTKAKARVGIQVEVNDVNDFVYDAQGRIAIELKFSLPSEPNGFTVVIPPTVSNGITYEYDDLGNLFTIPETTVQDESGTNWKLSGEGSYNLDEKNKNRAEFTIILSSSEGQELLKIPVKGSLILMPVTS